MSINKVQLGLHKKLTKDITTLKRNVRELKTPQQVGVDIIQVQSIPSSGYAELSGPLYLQPGNNGIANYSTGTFRVTNLETTVPEQTLWNFAYTIYVDPIIDFVGGREVPDPTFAFPTGSALTLGQLNFFSASWEDYLASSFSTNQPLYSIFIANRDTVAHQYWIEFIAFLPSTGADL